MALVLGTNSGFVTTAPTADPDESYTTGDEKTFLYPDTSPSTAVKIVEIGWYCVNAVQETNFEVGLYAADGNVVPNEAGTLLEVSRTNAKGTDAGWKRVTGLNWAIDGSTDYWFGVQIDNTASAVQFSVKSSGGPGLDIISSATTLNDPAGGGAIIVSNWLSSIYAVWEEEGPAGVTRKIKIGGTFVDKPIKTKVGGVFVDKPIKIKVGGTFQDA